MFLQQLMLRTPIAAGGGGTFAYLGDYGRYAAMPEKVAYKPNKTIPAGTLVIMNMSGYQMQHSTGLTDTKGNTWSKVTTTSETHGVMFWSRLTTALSTTDTITSAGPYVNQFTVKLAMAIGFSVPVGKTVKAAGSTRSNTSVTHLNSPISRTGLVAGRSHLAVRMTYANYPNGSQLIPASFNTTAGFELIPWVDYTPAWNDQYSGDNKRGFYGEYTIANGPTIASNGLSTTILTGNSNATPTSNVIAAFYLE